jgi:hypothetical protein
MELEGYGILFLGRILGFLKLIKNKYFLVILITIVIILSLALRTIFVTFGLKVDIILGKKSKINHHK